MPPILLVDGNNLGHVLGYISKATDRYDGAGLLACLDGVFRYLVAQGQEIEIVLFLDDVSAPDRLGGWNVKVAAVPDGDADAAIRAYAHDHADHLQLLVSGDRALCNDVALWGVVCVSPEAFISRYLVPAREAGFWNPAGDDGLNLPFSYVEAGDEAAPTAQEMSSAPLKDRGVVDRQRQIAALVRAEATLRGETLPPPQVYRLDLSYWSDAAELALYLSEEHLCREHDDLTDPKEMLAAICEHCSLQPRFFTSGRVINRVFRLLLCCPEQALSLDDLTRLAGTRRRKVRAAIEKYGERLGIVVNW